MSKDIKEYLRYYYGQDCIITAPDGIKYSMPDQINEYWIDRVNREGGAIQPILRKLESMRDEEMLELPGFSTLKNGVITGTDRDERGIYVRYKWPQADFPTGWKHSAVSLYFNRKEWAPTEFHYLLSRGFWIFGNDWFDEGLIIDKDSVRPEIKKEEL